MDTDTVWHYHAVTVIFACPSCSASHFKPDAEVRAGVNLLCRRCRKPFRVTASGVELLPEEGQEPAGAPQPVSNAAPEPAPAVAPEPILEAASEPAPAAQEPAFAAEQADIPAAPSDVALASAGGLADALEPDPVAYESVEPEPAAQPALDLAAELEPESESGSAPLPEPEPEPETIIESSSLDPFAAPSLEAETPAPEPEPEQPAAASVTPSEPDAVDIGFVAPAAPPSESSTRESAAEVKSPAPRRHTSEALGPSSAARAREVGQLVSAPLSRLLDGLPLPQRIAVAAGLAAPLVFVVLWLTSGRASEATAVWTTESVSLWAGPAADSGYPLVDTLGVRERLAVLEQTGDFVLVRDVFGRAGYVPRASVTNEAPAITPDEEFGGCRQAPIEAGGDACKERAQGQFNGCRDACDDESSCVKRCQERFLECLEGCDRRLSIPAPPESNVAEVEPPPSAEPAADAAQAPATAAAAEAEADNAKAEAAKSKEHDKAGHAAATDDGKATPKKRNGTLPTKKVRKKKEKTAR